MQIGDPLRTIVVEPLEIPVDEPAIDRPETEPSVPQPEPDKVPTTP